VKRFLVVMSVMYPDVENGPEFDTAGEEPVADFDTEDEALEFVAVQGNPSLYTIVDNDAIDEDEEEFDDEDEEDIEGDEFYDDEEDHYDHYYRDNDDSDYDLNRDDRDEDEDEYDSRH
jgi:hypothetical protein